MKISTSHSGIFFALIAYSLWGLMPIYFKLLEEVPNSEIISHRVIWSLGILVLGILITKRWAKLKPILTNKRTLLALCLSSSLIGVNWLLFIYAITSNQMLEASLGYYINPLINICFGLLFFKERMTYLQWVAIGLACMGVLFELIVLGTLPWLALLLATTFALYALVRKIIAVDALSGLSIETMILCPIAVIYLFGLGETQTGAMTQNGIHLNSILILSGITTTLPLVLFAAAATRLKLSALGFMQYIAPSIMWLLAVFIYNEPLVKTTLVTFAFIWLALLCFSVDGIIRQAKMNPI